MVVSPYRTHMLHYAAVMTYCICRIAKFTTQFQFDIMLSYHQHLRCIILLLHVKCTRCLNCLVRRRWKAAKRLKWLQHQKAEVELLMKRSGAATSIQVPLVDWLVPSGWAIRTMRGAMHPAHAARQGKVRMCKLADVISRCLLCDLCALKLAL